MQAFAEAKRRLGGGVDGLNAAADDNGGEQEEENGQVGADTAKSLEAFVDGKFMTVVMTLLTIFALWGDNIRVALFDKDADNIFYALFAVALFMFVIEFLINTVAKQDYKWGFFFVCVHPLPSIPTLRLKVSRYSMVSKAQDADQEEKLKAQARAAQNAKQAALKRIEASRLGRALSEQTTRRVIIGVLLMLFMLPLLQSSETNQSFYTGLSQIYWFGRSRCNGSSSNASFGCDGMVQQPGSSWIGEAGWKNMLWMYSRSSFRASYYPTHEGYWEGDPPYKLLWLRAPDYTNGGRLKDIVSIESELGVWNQTASCAGVRPSANCPYRDEEMSTYSYSPIECSSDADPLMYGGLGCGKAVAYARFETKSLQQRSNALDMLSTLFVCILLATLSIQFQNDTQKLVIAPIEKMVNIIKQLAEDPLRRPDVQLFKIVKSLVVVVGFGRAGAEIVNKSMNSGDGELNIMMPGRCIFGIFAYVGMRRLATLADMLGQDVTVLMNKVATIVHGCANRWGGVSNQNIDNGFLLVWKLESQHDPQLKQELKSEVVLKRSKTADRALFCGMKMIAELQRLLLRETSAIKGDAPFALTSLQSTIAAVDVGIAFHVGWAIEGPVGSDFKIDATYLGPDITRTLALQDLTKVYDAPILTSSKLYFMASVRTKERFMLVDYVRLGESKVDPHGIYALVLAPTTAAPERLPSTPVTYKLGSLIKPEDLAEVEDNVFVDEFPEYLSTVDVDVTSLIETRGISGPFADTFRRGFSCFVEGDWERAVTMLSQAGSGTGPASALLRYMESTGNRTPKEWDGWHGIHAIDG
ncbi:hypothetical protein FOZ62_011910 [Perkinsus olseni]|uniref:Guanylate cyclase domain-containing protein n=1 Tax=Perkinsus olseni TaxID=32597 RepID=A0A7J6Q294_PEROL|nr:hypothetical protein FOZ62_011910 [Perkinsus olseni]